MKINFNKAIYQVGNIIATIDGYLYLVAENKDGGYSYVNLNDHVVTNYETLEELTIKNRDEDDLKVNAEINVF